MEIRNNTQMHNSTSFGMALLKPQNLEEFAKATGVTRGGLAGNLHKRGVRQLIKELKGVSNFDVEFVTEDGKRVYNILDKNGKLVQVIDRDCEGLVKKSFELLEEELKALEGKKGFMASLKRIKCYAKMAFEPLRVMLINPKEVLPKPLLTAAKESKELDEAYIYGQKAERKAKQVMQKAVSDLNEAFGK